MQYFIKKTSKRHHWESNSNQAHSMVSYNWLRNHRGKHLFRPVQEVLLVTDYQMVLVIFKMAGHIPSGLDSYISNTLIHTYIYTPSTYKYITHTCTGIYVQIPTFMCQREKWFKHAICHRNQPICQKSLILSTYKKNTRLWFVRNKQQQLIFFFFRYAVYLGFFFFHHLL